MRASTSPVIGRNSGCFLFPDEDTNSEMYGGGALQQGDRDRERVRSSRCIVADGRIEQVFQSQAVTPVRRRANMARTILLIIVVLLLLGSLPTWPYSTSWGYYPSGGLGLLLVVLIVLLLFRRVPG
jgi:hypothetical protein